MIVGNGSVFTFNEKAEIHGDHAVVIKGDTIVEIGPTALMREKYSDEEYLDVEGKMIWPGIINAHGHFYGMYSRGMALKDEAPTNFLEILERLWWRLDKALDAESTYYSAMVCLVAALRAGCTTVVDHHASPSFILGSLDEIQRASDDIGMRSCLCYEVTDRNGIEGAEEGIEENVRFIKKCRQTGNKMTSGTFGMHAAFTISDETMEKSAKALTELRKDGDVGIHIHVAEGDIDEKISQEKYGKSIIERLNGFKMLGPQTILAHCVFASDEEMDIVKNTGSLVVHNPQSNMNNAVGVADVKKMLDKGILVGMGTDGVTYNMFKEAGACYYVHKLRSGDPRAMSAESFNMLMKNNAKIASRFFPESVNLGVLEPGAAADLIVLDYTPPTPVSGGNLPWHFQFGMDGYMVDTSIIGGKLVMKDKKILTVDSAAVHKSAKELAPEVWERF